MTTTDTDAREETLRAEQKALIHEINELTAAIDSKRARLTGIRRELRTLAADVQLNRTSETLRDCNRLQEE